MSQWDITYYIRDAQGNHITTIERDFTDTDEFEATDELNISETVLYGSDRLGTRGWVKSDDTYPASLIVRHPFTHSGVNESGEYQDITPSGSPVYSTAPEDYFSSLEGAKHYELKNHLGNVLATVSDKRDVEVDASNNVQNYTAKVSDVSFYYPFGSLMPGLSDFGGEHRFGFNGFEKDDEIKGKGNHLGWGDYGYDTRIVHRYSPDRLTSKYPSLSPYSVMANNPIMNREKDGRDFGVFIDHNTKTITIVANYYTVKENATQAQAAVDFWNKQSGEFEYQVLGDNGEISNYSISFDLCVEVINPVDNDNRYMEALEAATPVTGDLISNSYLEYEGATKDLQAKDENLRGAVDHGEYAFVDSKLADDASTGPHEVGHTLGMGHIGTYKNVQAPGTTRYPEAETVSSVNVAAVLSHVGLAKGQVTSGENDYQGRSHLGSAGSKPKNFDSGRVVEKK